MVKQMKWFMIVGQTLLGNFKKYLRDTLQGIKVSE